jgi:hypothetical protein
MSAVIQDLPNLFYRGNFSLKRRRDYTDAYLQAEYPNGYTSEAAIVGMAIREWDLTYSALVPATIQLPNGQTKDRLSYVWDFYCDSKDNGNRPFYLIDPAEQKRYLCVFKDRVIEVEMMNYTLSTTGLTIRQTFLKTMNFLDDGSIGDDQNPAQI